MCNCNSQNDAQKNYLKKKKIEEQIKKRKERVNKIYQKKFL